MNILNRIAGFVLLASFAGFALGAGSGDEPPKRTVSYADLDLHRKAGVEALFSRIKFAAHAVCEPQSGFELAMRTNYQRCVDAAIGRAIADVNAPVLAVLYRAGSAQ